MNQQELIGKIFIWAVIMWYILIASEFNILQQITTNLLEHKNMIKSCVDNFVLDWLTFMFNGNSLLVYTSLIYPNKYEKSDKIILKYFQ